MTQKSNNEDEESIAVVNGGLIRSQCDAKSGFKINDIQFYPDRMSLENRYKTQQPMRFDEEEAEYNYRASDDEDDSQNSDNFRQTVFNPQKTKA